MQTTILFEAAVFLFIYFLFLFFTKIYFHFQNLQEYTPAAPLPGGRDLVALLRGGRGFSAKILRLQVTKIFYTLQIDYVIIIFVDTVD